MIVIWANDATFGRVFTFLVLRGCTCGFLFRPPKTHAHEPTNAMEIAAET